MPIIHLVGDFSAPYRGAELSLLDLADVLETPSSHAVTIKVWSAAPPHVSYAQNYARKVQHIQEFAAVGQQAFPQGGNVVLAGIHVPLGPWVAFGKAQRVILQHNIPQYQLLFECVEQIKQLWGKPPEITYVSPMLKVSAGLPGFVHAAPMQLAPYWSIERSAPASDKPFVVGRLSSDSPSKHHPQDMALYRSFAARGLMVRVMGGTCLASPGTREAGIELLPMATQSAPQFLRDIDLFFYRTDRLAETFGRVIFEALACGLPVVAQTYAGYTAYLQNGLEIELVESQEAAFNAVMAICNDTSQYMLRSRAGKQATERVFSDRWRVDALAYYLRAE